MAQFTVNATRFDPYKNFKFRVKWDGKYVAGISKVGALKRTTEPVKHREGGDPSTSRKSPGRSEFEAITLERGRHPRPGVRGLGQQGLELRCRPGRGVLAQGLPQGPDHRGLQRGRAGRPGLQGLPVLGLGVPGAARPRRQRQRRRHPAPQARERGLGARPRGPRADGAQLHVTQLTSATVLELWEAGLGRTPAARASLLLAAVGERRAGRLAGGTPRPGAARALLRLRARPGRRRRLPVLRRGPRRRGRHALPGRRRTPRTRSTLDVDGLPGRGPGGHRRRPPVLAARREPGGAADRPARVLRRPRHPSR